MSWLSLHSSSKRRFSLGTTPVSAEPEINLIPFIDVLLVVLIFLMIAVILDFSEKVEKFIVSTIKIPVFINDNYKDIVMRFTQQRKYKLPVYILEGIKGPPHQPKFLVRIEIHSETGKILAKGKGFGHTKKEAEQDACKNIISSNHIFKPQKNHYHEIHR